MAMIYLPPGDEERRKERAWTESDQAERPVPLGDEAVHEDVGLAEPSRQRPRTERARTWQDLEGKPVISLTDGKKIGLLSDLLFDPDTLQLMNILISGTTSGLDNLFSRKRVGMPAQRVRVWGEDVVIVEDSTTQQEEQLPKREQCVQLTDQLKGRYVVSKDGVRVGQVGDVLIDQEGRLAGYELSQVFVENRLKETKRIPVDATYSLGKDVLIIDMDKLGF